MSRRPIIAGNWKMNKNHFEAVEFANSLATDIKNEAMVEMVICAPFTSLTALHNEFKNTNIGLGAQNVYYESSGAYTGEISASMLTSCGCEYVIIGHSERRQYFGENDVSVNQKTKFALESGLNPIICCGESLNEREAGNFEAKILSQVELALSGVQLISSTIKRVIIAYEPIWAIGTGKTCDEKEANRILGLIRNKIADLYNSDVANQIRLLYGGSVKPATIGSQIKEEHIDGALVGGASLKPDDFSALVRLCK